VIGRYRIVRGSRPSDDPLPTGVRQDTRKHTSHPLRPDEEMVRRFLDSGDDAGFERFRRDYLALLEARFEHDRAPFDELVRLAARADVYLGCNCPTRRQPDVSHCHTWLALEFLKGRYPDLEVRSASAPS
jgi:uncharacterized protein YeaO (DUF488 family)